MVRERSQFSQHEVSVFPFSTAEKQNDRRNKIGLKSQQKLLTSEI